MTKLIKACSVFICFFIMISIACQSWQQNMFIDPSEKVENERLFNRLTGHIWCSLKDEDEARILRNGPADYTRNSYNFEKNGRYDYSYSVYYSDVSRVPGESESGFWNFKRISNNSGIIYLGYGIGFDRNAKPTYFNSDVLHFSFNPDGSLTLGDMLLWGCKEVKDGDSQQHKAVDQLQEIKTSELFAQLIRHKWKKASQFDIHKMPTHLEFQANGNYKASYRNEECFYTDVFSVRRNNLIRHAPQGVCDETPQPTIERRGIFHNYPVKFENGFLIFEGYLYVPENYQLEGGMEHIALGYDTTDLRIYFSKVIKSAETVPMKIELTNNNPNGDSITAVSISEQSARRTDSGYQLVGNENILSVVNFSTPVEVGQTRTFETAPTFSLNGSGSVSFIVTYQMDNKPFKQPKTSLLNF